MTSATSMESAARYGKVQQQALSAYIEALRDALAPLEERYRKAAGNLAGVQQNYVQELGSRLTAAYKSYGETVAAIPAGSPRLEPAVDAYNALLGTYAKLADSARWTEAIAPAQRKLNETIIAAQGQDDAPGRTQEALEAFYGELNDLARNDSSAAELSDAQARYAGQLQALQADIEKGWQQAVEAVNEHIGSAVAETGKAFDVGAALERYADELKAIGEDYAQAYRAAAEAATRVWQENAPDSDAAATADAAGGSAFAAAASSSSPLAPVAPASPIAPAAVRSASSAPDAAMAVSPATMPRASWVNIPQPPAESASGPEARKPPAGKTEARSEPSPGGTPPKPKPSGDKAKPAAGRTGAAAGKRPTPAPGGKPGGTGGKDT